MAFVRGSVRRTLLILTGLCLFGLLFACTPRADTLVDHAHDDNLAWGDWEWSHSSPPPLTSDQKETLIRQKELRRQRARAERDRLVRLQAIQDRREEELERQWEADHHSARYQNQQDMLSERPIGAIGNRVLLPCRADLDQPQQADRRCSRTPSAQP
ncbi:hypothetical protein B0O80DRAFT_466333 [Mortierella sp. GBAus27b]|nr:hypothetical protein B0O80DRAFT_466333 [Mortierella sp. GBAus27b]